MRRTLVIAGACAAAALALGGCGGDEDVPGVATADPGAPRPSASGSAGTDVVARYVAEVRKYVTCMRDEGIDLPDPGPTGDIDYTKLGANGKFKTDPRFIRAMKKCSHLNPPRPDELNPKPEPLTPQQIQWKRDYAKCVRENGVPSFPDPGPDGHFSNDDQPLPRREANALGRAVQICEPLIEGRPKGTPNPHVPGRG